jgi:hypothetical protein
LAQPSVTGFKMQVTGCLPADIQIDAVRVTAGLVRVVANKKGKTIDYGIPGRVKITARPLNATLAKAVEGKCSFLVPARLKAADSYDVKRKGCKACHRCMKALKFNCAETYRLRVQAQTWGGLRTSAWSVDLLVKADCSPAAAACYG